MNACFQQVLGYIGSDSFGVSDRGNIAAAESAAWVMLAIILLVIGAVGWFCWTLGRRSRQPDDTLERLERLEREARERSAEARKPSPTRDPWEKPADWWKNE